MKNNWKKTAALLLSLIVLISIIPVNVLALMVPVNITETSGAVSLRGVFKDRAVDIYEFYLNEELIRSQKIKGGDILYEPETPAESGKTFLGWYNGENRIDFASGQWNVPADYEASGATITLEPRFGKLYFATFYSKNEENTPIMARRTMRDGDTLDTSSLSVEPDDNTQQFAYWVDENGTEVKSPLSLTITAADGTETPVWQDADGRQLPAGEDGNLHLYPYFHTGHWISFNKNLSVVAVSYTAPQFVVNGEYAVKPTDPIAQSTAYSFREWCRDAEGTVPFDFETEIIDEDTVLFAAWDTGVAPYSVVIWKQNVTDRYDATEKTYEYVESYQRSGQIGENANVDESQGDINPTKIRGFYLGSYDQDVEIKPDGSTVVNVYYNRQRVNVIIHRPIEEYLISGNLYFYGWETETITGLFEQKVSMYPEYEGKIYRFDGDFVGYNLNTYTSGIPEKDDNGVPLSEEARKTLYRPQTMATGGFTSFGGGDEVNFSSGNEEETGLIYNVGELAITRTALYIYQTEDGEWPAADGSMDEKYTRVWNMRTTGTASLNIIGTTFTLIAYDVNQRWESPDFATYKVSPNATNKLTIPKAQIPAGSQTFIYYLRHKFNVEYWDGDTKVASESIYYQKAVKDSPDHLTDVVPNNPDPAKYKFVGWSLYEDKHSAADVTDFDFEMPSKTVKVYAVWAEVRYRVVLDTGADDAEMDERQERDFTTDYQDTLDPTFMMAATRMGHTLKGWYRNNGVVWNFANGMTLTLADDPSAEPDFHQSENREYYYYTITLTAKWRSKAPISVVYDLNGGTNGTGDDKAFTDETAYFQDGSAIIVSVLPTPPEGLKFAGWADANGVVHRGGDAVTLEESIIADGKVTLTATYGADVPTGKIVYRPNGGTGSEIMTPSGDEYYEYNEKVALLTEAEAGFTRANYHMLGWALEADAEEPDFDFGESVLVTSSTLKNTTDNILYAVWEEDEVTIYYEVASDNTGMGTVSIPSETVKIVSGTAAGATASPAATTSSAGYRFKHWTDESGNVVSTDPTFKPGKNSDGLNFSATYYAHFQVTYRVFHYLEGTTTRVAPPEGGWADINEQLNPEKATTYVQDGKEIPLIWVSSDPAIPYTVQKGVNDIIYYYKLPEIPPTCRLTVHYWIGTTKAADSFTKVYNSGDNYNVASPVIPGYTPDKARVTGTITEDTVLNVYYTANIYNLTVNYIFVDGSTAAPSYTAKVAYGDTYSVTSPAVDGYTANILVCEGKMPARDVTLTVIYTANPGPAPAGNPPLPGHVPYTILEDYDTALGLSNLNINAGDVYE